MSIGLDWSGDDDTLSQNTNVYGQVYGSQTQGLKKQVEGQAKSEISANRATAAAVSEQTSDEQYAAGMNAISGTIQGLIQGATSFAMAGAGGAGGAAGKSEALASKSAALDVKRQAALKAGNTAKAQRLGQRSINLSNKSARLGLKAEFGGSGKGLFGKSKGMPIAEQQALGLNDPAIPAQSLRQPAPVNMDARTHEAWLNQTRGANEVGAQSRYGSKWADQPAAVEWAKRFSDPAF